MLIKCVKKVSVFNMVEQYFYLKSERKLLLLWNVELFLFLGDVPISINFKEKCKNKKLHLINKLLKTLS